MYNTSVLILISLPINNGRKNMRYLVFYICMLFFPSLCYSQRIVVNDTLVGKHEIIIPDDIDQRNLVNELEGIKTLDDGFLMDMRPLTLPEFRLSNPISSFDYHTYSPVLDYSRIFNLSNRWTFGQVVHPSISPWGFYSFYQTPMNLQSATYRLNNGARITTYGEYNADGYKVHNPSALPWQRNNFRGGFEFKSSNGNFGIRIEVNRVRETPFGF